MKKVSEVLRLVIAHSIYPTQHDLMCYALLELEARGLITIRESEVTQAKIYEWLATLHPRAHTLHSAIKQSPKFSNWERTLNILFPNWFKTQVYKLFIQDLEQQGL